MLATRAHLLKQPYKHLFLILGEPRTGKTTLAAFACTHEASTCLDTDGLQERSLLQEIQDRVVHFYQSQDLFLCCITVGKHRKHANKIQAELTQFVRSKNILLSVCHVTRHTPVS